MSCIDWKIEIEKAESWAKKECCEKFIDLAKQIADEANAYRSMWSAEFDLRKKALEALILARKWMPLLTSSKQDGYDSWEYTHKKIAAALEGKE